MDARANTEIGSPRPMQAAKKLLERPWLLTISLASGLCVLYLVGVFINWSDADARSLYANLGMIPIGLAATILALSASRVQADRRSQWAWRLLGAGLACFFAGDLLFFIYQNIMGTSPFPSLADAGYLTYYPLAFAGLLCFPNLPERRRRRILPFLDYFIVVLGGAVIILYFFLRPAILSSRDDLFAYSLSIGYPAGDLLLLAGIARLLLRRVPKHPWSILLLSAGLIVGLAADVVYGYQSVQDTFESGGIPDAAYMLSWTLFAWAGYAELVRTRDKTQVEGGWNPRWAGTILPAGLVVLGVGLLVFLNRALLGTDKGVVILGAAGLILLSFLRQSLAVHVKSRHGTPQDRRPDNADEH